jgi:hypothetical protein
MKNKKKNNERIFVQKTVLFRFRFGKKLSKIFGKAFGRPPAKIRRINKTTPKMIF